MVYVTLSRNRLRIREGKSLCLSLCLHVYECQVCVFYNVDIASQWESVSSSLIPLI